MVIKTNFPLIEANTRTIIDKTVVRNNKILNLFLISDFIIHPIAIIVGIIIINDKVFAYKKLSGALVKLVNNGEK